MTTTNPPKKTFALRLDEDEHRSLALVAGLEGVTLTAYIRDAISKAVLKSIEDPKVAARAAERMEELRAELERSTQALGVLFPPNGRDPEVSS